jgi:hypothetical protein
LARESYQGQASYRLSWLDDPASRYVVEIDRRQCDRTITAEESGRDLPLVWYVQTPSDDGEGCREIRRETIRVDRTAIEAARRGGRIDDAPPRRRR